MKSMEEAMEKGNDERGEWKRNLDEAKEHWKKSSEEAKTREGGNEHPWEGMAAGATKKCVVITDSNGRGTSANTIKNHVPKEESEGLEIEVVVAYTMEEAFHRIRRGEIEVEGKVVVVDNVTNDVRKVREPWEVTRRVGKLLDVLEKAAAVVVVQVKPIRSLDVTDFNKAIHRLCVSREGVFGCHTQITMRDLASDGFHVSPHCGDIVDKTYACAILGKPVPCPTPPEGFFHPWQSAAYEQEWPRVDENKSKQGGQERVRNAIHGWRWE